MTKKKPPVHTVPNKNGTGWNNVQDGEVISHHRTKDKAEEKGKQQAKKDQTEHRIHKKDGKIGESNSYGNDPNPPKDKR
ncbi:DUF2188 domain-containing protein [Fictibacillus sp. JL2B1089]|uniref:DUF2188 domain-containing protein n=1 Tax=Fictibacillus sp. JL2B1089 TaxID=3399565 RepID=UPI003A85E395